jgi:5-formyltetrahydrofolate cyclo-ligase
MKKKIRDKFLKLREIKYFDLDKKNQSFFSNQITKICKNHKVKKIGFYYPINYEVDIVSIVSKIKIKNLKPFLPVVEKNNKMSFREWKTLEPFYVNRFGILEPNKKNKKTKPQLILTPLVAFDQNKNRLGYGRGFYDRFLNQVSKQKNIISIGIAFSFQEAKKIPSEKHDKKLDYILTEKKLIS